MSLSSLTLAVGKDLVWWLITTAASKTSISSHWALRTHYPPNCYHLMGQVSIYIDTQICFCCYLNVISFVLMFSCSIVFVCTRGEYIKCHHCLWTRVEVRAVSIRGLYCRGHS